MKCMMCENLSLSHICPTCQTNFLTPSLYTRLLPNGIKVYSFYKYDEIKELLFTKHTPLGYHIYTILAKNAFKPFGKNFTFEYPLHAVAVDDHARDDFAHTAVLAKHLKSSSIKPLFGKLRAQNHLSYSGKSKEFRMENPRNFELKKFTAKEVILVDDIITTGTTLMDAIEVLESAGKKVLFCLTLVDASKKM